MNANVFWDFWAKRYDRLWLQPVILFPSRRLIHERLEGLGLQPGRLLDVGCGIGQFATEIATRYPDCQVVACDPSPEMIERAHAGDPTQRVSFRLGSLAAVEQEPAFDVIVCMHALPYFADKVLALRQMASLLRAGGRLFVIHANAITFYDRLMLGVVKRLVSRASYPTPSELQELLRESGLSPEAPVRLPGPSWIPSVHLVEAEHPR
jgi:ubiquinone/menaquinone biosynthesis C-methylase UbiE